MRSSIKRKRANRQHEIEDDNHVVASSFPEQQGLHSEQQQQQQEDVDDRQREDYYHTIMMKGLHHRRLAVVDGTRNKESKSGHTITSNSTATSDDMPIQKQQQQQQQDPLAREAMMFYQDLLPTSKQQQQHNKSSSSTAGRMLGPYPVTSALLWAVHLLYVVQWSQQRRRRRRRNYNSSSRSLTYRTLVEKKRFYRWWSALLSQYHPDVQQHSTSTTATNNGESEATESGGNNSNLTVDMGHAPDDRGDQHQQQSTAAAAAAAAAPVLLGDWQALQEWTAQQSRALYQSLPAAWRDSAAVGRGVQAGRVAYATVQRAATVAGGKSLLLLLYNAHLLWSCRALERHYSTTATVASNNNNSDGIDSNDIHSNPLQYLRVVVSVGVWGTLLEIGLSRYFLRALSPSATPDPPNDAAAASNSSTTLLSVEPEESATYDSPLMKSFRKKIRHRTMGVSLSMLSTAVLMIYRFQFPHVGTPILPWLPLNRYWLHLNPILSHLAVLFLLHHISVAATGDTATVWVALGCGNFVGMLWGSGWLDFCGEAYWGNGVLLLAVALTVLSLKARSPYATYLLWIDHVGWNERGHVLLYDSGLDRYVEAPVERFPVGVDAAGSDSESDDSLSNGDDDEDDEEDESGRAFPPADDNEIYGRLPSFSFMEMGQLGDANDDGSEGDENNETARLITPSSTGNSSQSHFRSRRMNSAAPADVEDRGR